MEKTNILASFKKYHLLSAVDNIKKIVNRADKIGVSNADIGLLHSSLTTLAKAYDSVEGENTEIVSMEMALDQATAIWHCSNMCLQNKLLNNKAHQANAMEIMSILAPHIDAARNPEQLELPLGETKSSQPQQKLIGVE